MTADRRPHHRKDGAARGSLIWTGRRKVVVRRPAEEDACFRSMIGFSQRLAAAK